MKLFGSLLAMVVVSGLAAGIQAGEKKSEMPLDKDFLLKAATINNAEIQIGNMANKRAASSQVKGYASMLVKDHKAAGDKMVEVLKGRKLAIATGVDKETKEEISRLSKLEGNEFDRAFIHCMVKGHKEAIALFENQAKNGQEEDIRSFAKEILPDLRKHLSKANELAKTSEK
jgi:putative membrane protein